MGFFHEDVKLEAPVSKGRKTYNAETLATMPRGCEHCSLKANWSWISTPQMPVYGNREEADILVLGEAPGAEEDKEGIPFVGDSGRLLHRAIPGRDADRVLFSNTVRCRPNDNATPNARDAHACSIHLEEDLAELPNVKAILGIGQVPLQRMFPGQMITHIHGTRFPVRIGERVLWYYPIIHPAFVLRTGGERSAAHGVFKSDIQQFFKELDSWGTPTIWEPDPKEVIQCYNEQDARDCLAEMHGVRGVDLETHKLKPYLKDAKLLTASISDENITIAFPIEHPENPTDWGMRVLLETVCAFPWVAHNAQFEYMWLYYMAQKYGLPFDMQPFEDSMAAARLYHRREHLLDLASLTRIHLGADVKQAHKVNINNMIAEPLERVLPYNGLDALSSVHLLKKTRKYVDEDNYQRFLATIHSTSHMELQGLTIDEAVLGDLKKEWEGKQDAAIEKAKTIYEVRTFEREKQIEFNIASGDHVGEALVEYGKVTLPKTSKKGDDGKKVEGGKWSTDEQDLRNNAGDNPLALTVLDYREASKQCSTYVDSTYGHIEASADRRIHPSYTTLHTATTRLSSTKPNAQNYPKRRHRGIRRQVVPDRLTPGGLPAKHIFLAVDMGQIDARIYGCATKDRNLVQDFIDKVDIHTHWLDRLLVLEPKYLEKLAIKTNETDEKKIRKGARDIIKSDFVFSSFYGSNANASTERTGVDIKKTEKLLAEFWARYPQAKRWLDNQRTVYAETGSVFTLCGVERHGILWGNEVINTPIQGTTAHVVNDAQNELARLSLEYNEPYLMPRINIHDDLMFVLPDVESQIEEYIEVIAAAMLRVRYNWQVVPFTVECKVGYNWCDMEEIAVMEGEYIQ